MVANQPRGSSYDFIATSTREVGHFWRHGKKVRIFGGEPRAPGRVALEQPLSPGFSNLQVGLRAEGEFAFEPEAEA